MRCTIASGKGGTGKTTVAVSLALSLKEIEPVQFIDCDVEGPNAHLFLHPQNITSQEVFLPVPEINEEKCTHCGLCAQICAYKALAVLPDQVLVFPELCHGCGGCSLLCPEKAIVEKGMRIGLIHQGQLPQLEFLQGRLDVGLPLSPPIIRELKKLTSADKPVIIDAPPGTSCPAVESMKGSDFVLLVTEPTPFGLNDLKLSVETLKKLHLPAGVIINRADVSFNHIIQEYCQQENLPILMTIPFDRLIATAYSQGKSLVEVHPPYRQKFQQLWLKIREFH